jgi:anaerobic selenocysteine-containing dehydrogenase
MQPSSKYYTTCPLCEATCGLEIQHDGARITRIAGDEKNTFSRGFICPKGAALNQLHEDPDRLQRPLVRDDSGRFREVEWAEAFAAVQAGLAPILQSGEKDAIAIYLGNPNVHSLAGTFFPRALIRATGTRNIFTASTVDQMPKHVSCGLMFGDAGAIPVPDIDRTGYLLMLGANPWESNGSLCTAPDFPGRIKELRERGGRFVVVDPRRTRTAEHADQHIAIRPGTDAHLLLGIARVLFEEGLVRLGNLEPHVAGLARLKELVAPFELAAVSKVTGIPADTIQGLARDLAKHERAAVYGRIGTHTTRFGTLAAWAVDVLNVITGHLDVPGGAMWALPAHARRSEQQGASRFKTGRWKSRVKGYPEVKGELPVATLADEIEMPGTGQIRALITVAGNPVLSTPQGVRLDRALAGLDFMVSVDPYLNETTRRAHVILPPPSSFYRSQYDLALYGLAIRNFAQWSEPLLEPKGPGEAEILARLVLIASGQDSTADPGFVYQSIERYLLDGALSNNPLLAGKQASDLSEKLVGREPVDRYVEILVRAGEYGDKFGAKPGGLSLEVLRANPHGVDLGPLTPRLPELLRTSSGKIELAPELICNDVPRLAATLSSSSAGEILLIGRRDLRSNNSWMHNVPRLIRGRPRCTLQVHPQDAERLRLQAGGMVRVTSRVGDIVVPIEITDSILSGVVSLPHGFGHDLDGSRLRVAAEHAGANVNTITDAEVLDPLSGNAALSGVPVTLSPA